LDRFWFVIDEQWRPAPRIFQQAQCGFDDRVLAGWVVRPIEGVTVVERHPQASRRPDSFGYETQQLDRDCGDALAFQLGGYQTYSLGAHGSNRTEQGYVYAVFDQTTGCLWNRLLDQASRGGNGAQQG
jgi:hypothetical protein